MITLRTKRWSKEEEEKLEKLWGSELTIDEILAEFPNRTLSAIYLKASRMRLTRP